MPRSRNSRSASPQKPLSAESSEIERRKIYQDVHDIFCEAIDGDVIKLVLQECDWKEEESIEKLLVIAENQEEQKKYKSKLHRIAEGIFGSLRSEDYSSTGVSSTLSPSEKVIRRPLKTSTAKNDKNGDKATEGILPRGHQNQAYVPHSQTSENVASVDEIEMDLNFPQLPLRPSENNLSSASSSVHSFSEVSKKKPSSSKTALLSQAQNAFNQQFDDAEGSQRWEECKDKLSEHYLTNLKGSNDSVPMQISSASVYPDDPAILQAELARPRSEPVHAKLDVEKQRSESGRSFPVRLLSRSPDSAEDMKTVSTSMLGHGAMKITGTDDLMRSTGDIDDTVLKCIYEIQSDLLDEEELQHRLRAQHDNINDSSAADNKSSTHSSNKPMTLPTIGLSVNAAEFVPRSKPVATTSANEVVDSPSPEPTSRTKRSNSVEIKAGVKNISISSPSIPIRSPLTVSPALSPGLSPQMNSPVANLTGSPMFITPKWPQVHSGMPPLQHVVLAPPQQYVHPTPAHHISPPAYRFPPAASVPYSTRMVYSVAPSPLFRAAGVSPYVQQPNTQNIEERAAVATGQPIMATSESSQLGQPTAALNTAKLVAQSSFEQKVEKIRKQHQSGVKILIILRGLPGSGKTTLARALQFNGIILSTDDFFMNGNRYEYKPEKLNEAHQWNKERAKEAMKMGKSPIVIDNTNTMVWEFKSYITMAVNNTYHVEIFEPDTPWKMKPSELARRNIHGVPLEHIKRMLQRYEHNVNLDAIIKKKSTPDLKTTEETELLSRFNTSIDEKFTFSQGKDVRFHNLHKGEEFRKQKSGESDSDSLSSYHSDTWSNQSSRNASPKPLRSSLKTPGTLQKMEKLKPLASVKPLSITPTVRKVKRKAIKQIESKLSENTLKEVDEMVKEHVNGQILSVEDVSKTEGELKALLQFCSIDDSELTAAEELIGLKLHDAIHQSFEGSDPGIDPSGSCSDSDGDTKNPDDIPELMEPKSFDYVGNTLSDFAGDINSEDNITEDGKMKYVCEPVKKDRGFDKDLTTMKDELNDCKSDGNGSDNETVIPNWKDIALLKKNSGSQNSNTCIINDTQVIDENYEVKKLELDDEDKEFELKYWGESDIKQGKVGPNFETVENPWIGEKWENSDKDDEIIKPQRRKKNRVSHDLSLDNDSAENTSQEKLNKDSSIKKPAVPNVNGDEGDDVVHEEVNGDSDDLNNIDIGQTMPNNLVCSDNNLISNNLEKQFTLDVLSNNELRNEENNTYSENSINLPPSENNLLLSGRNCFAGNDNHSVHDRSHSSINSSLKLLKDSYTDTESAPKSSDKINHCDKHVVDEVASKNVQDITMKDSDNMLKNENCVDSIDVEVYDIKQSSDLKSMNMLTGTDELEKETLKLVPDKDGGAVRTPKKKSSRKRQEDKKKVPFLNSEDTEKFKKADWSSFPLVSNETVAVSNNKNILVKGKEMRTVDTMTSIEYFNIEVCLNQGGFIGEDITYLTGNPKKLVHSLSEDVNSDLKKVSGSPAEICSLEKSTTTADLVAMNDSESVEFLRTCFPAVPDEELECVLEICSTNVEWAINLLLDWKYSMNLTKDEKKNFSDKMAEIKKDGSMDTQMELADEIKSPPSLLDTCFDFIEKEKIADRADIEHQLIKTSKDRLDTIEKDNITKIILQRSLSHGENSLDRNRKSGLSKIATDILMIDNAKYDVSKEKVNVFANDNKSESESSKKVNREEDSATNDDFVGSRLMTDRTTEPMMTLDLQPETVVQLEDMFGSLECRDNVNDKLSVSIDRKTAWLLYQCVKNCLATSHINHDEHQLIKDEELARKLQEEENSYKRVDSKVSNGSRPKRGAPTIGYSVRGTMPSEIEPVAWARGNQSLAEIMQEQQKIQDRENDFRRMVEYEGAHSVISTRLKRQKLYEAFPKVDRAQLDDIFQASCFNLTDTIQVISTSLGEDPRKIPASTVMTPASSNDEQKLLEATKLKSVEDMLDSYSLHPAASKDYQDGVEPEYEDYRGEANLHHKLRHECFVKAREAYRRGLKQVASFYSQQGHQHTQKLKEANMRASDQILADRNNDIEKNLTLDLHGLHIDEAREALNRIIPQKEKERCKQLTVITGRGSHSRGGVAKLRPSVIDYLNKNKYSYTEVSIGVFKVSLKYRTPDR